MAHRADAASSGDVYAAILSAEHPVLPIGAKVRYKAEGGANIVYDLSATPVSPVQALLPPYLNAFPRLDVQNNHFWDGKLLRLRKNLPWAVPCAVMQADFLKYIYPHFDIQEMVEQHLVEVGSSGIIDQLNQDLRRYEETPPKDGGRPQLRLGVYLAEDGHGLLVEDMTAARGFTLLELKAKWLVQSPSAPKGSKRCRTCARHARMNAKKIQEGKTPEIYFCPLDLVSQDDPDVYRAARTILGLIGPMSAENLIQLRQLCQWAKGSPLLRRLKTLQAAWDRMGVFAASLEDKHFLAAMTIRDCSIFLRVPDDPTQPITDKIGDLDLKRPDKAEYWRQVETELVQEGWYLGTETEDLRQPFYCNLFPEYWTLQARVEEVWPGPDVALP